MAEKYIKIPEKMWKLHIQNFKNYINLDPETKEKHKDLALMDLEQTVKFVDLFNRKDLENG